MPVYAMLVAWLVAVTVTPGDRRTRRIGHQPGDGRQPRLSHRRSGQNEPGERDETHTPHDLQQRTHRESPFSGRAPDGRETIRIARECPAIYCKRGRESPSLPFAKIIDQAGQASAVQATSQRSLTTPAIQFVGYGETPSRSS